MIGPAQREAAARSEARQRLGFSVLAFFDRFEAKHGRPPTIVEMREEMGVGLPAIRRVVSPRWWTRGARTRRYTVTLSNRTKSGPAFVATYAARAGELWGAGSSADEISRELGISSMSVRNVLRATGQYRRVRRFLSSWSAAERARLAGSFAAGTSIETLAERHDASPSSIAAVVFVARSAELVTTPWSAEDRARAVQRRKDGATIRLIAVEFRRSFNSVERMLAREQAPKPALRTDPYSDSEQAEARLLRGNGMSYAAIAARLARSPKSVEKFFARARR
jgi:DNA-binding CsgD family transcriptional regulator